MKSKKIIIYGLLILAALFCAGNNYVAAAEEDGITLTWQDVRQLFDLNGDKIKLTWQEFQRLLQQMGHKTDVNIQVEGGVVTLSRERFKELLQKMPPAFVNVATPPRDYIVTEASYSGSGDNTNCRFTVRFNVYVFGRDRVKYVPIPILSADTAVSDITVDGLPGLLQLQGGWYQINLKSQGYHEVKAVFSTIGNKQYLSMPIIRSVVNGVDFSVPFEDYEISIQSALNPRMANKKISAFIPTTNQLVIKWQPKSKQRVKAPALFYADTHAVISVAADIIKIETRVDLEVLQSSLDTIALRVPDKDEVVRVTGSGIKNWQVRETDVGRVLEIHLGYDVNSNFEFTVSSERMLAADTLGIQFTGLQVLEARRETGALGITAQSEVEVEVKPNGELEALEFHQLPKKILDMTTRPVLYSYKYAHHPFGLDIGLHKHQQLEGISTVIESASGTALFLPEGKMLFKMDYTVRNSFKQFMELDLPENASIWTVLVDNKREKASRNKKGKVLIPLVRSSGNGDQLKSFKVQLIYTRPFAAFRLRGSEEHVFPKVDIFMNKIRMEMFLPEGYAYNFDKGDWKELEVAPKPRPQKKSKRKESGKRDKGYSERRSSKPDAAAPAMQEPMSAEEKEEAVAEFDDNDTGADEFKKSVDGVDVGVEGGVEGGVPGVVLKEIVVAGKAPVIDGRKLNDTVQFAAGLTSQAGTVLTGPVGLNSIAVDLPISGQKFVFTRTIIDKGETFPLKFSYFHQQTKKWLYIVFGVLVLLGLGFLLSRVFRKKAYENPLLNNEK